MTDNLDEPEITITTSDNTNIPTGTGGKGIQITYPSNPIKVTWGGTGITPTYPTFTVTVKEVKDHSVYRLITAMQKLNCGTTGHYPANDVIEAIETKGRYSFHMMLGDRGMVPCGKCGCMVGIFEKDIIDLLDEEG